MPGQATPKPKPRAPTARDLEIRYIRLQTVIAGISLLSSISLSIVGIWIGAQLNAAADAQREHDERGRLALTCASLAIQLADVSTKSAGRLDAQLDLIRGNLDRQCKAVDAMPGELMQIQTAIDQERRDVRDFLTWAAEPKSREGEPGKRGPDPTPR